MFWIQKSLMLFERISKRKNYKYEWSLTTFQTSNFVFIVQGTTCIMPQRYVLTLMGFLALFNAFAMRANLTIAITKMTFPVDNSDDHASVDNSLCPMPDIVTANETDESHDLEFYAVSVRFDSMVCWLWISSEQILIARDIFQNSSLCNENWKWSSLIILYRHPISYHILKPI